MLDLGAGGGRHAFEAMRRGAVVTALDADAAQIKDVSAMMAAIGARGTGRPASGAGRGTRLVGDALALPFPPSAFDRVIAAEVLEHIPDDRGAVSELVRVLRPGGTMAVTVPRWWPELLTLGALRRVPPHARRPHPDLPPRRAASTGCGRPGCEPYASHHAHALHSPYWWLRARGRACPTTPIPGCGPTTGCWSGTSPPHTVVTRVPEALLNPVLGKSLVVYLRKPA